MAFELYSIVRALHVLFAVLWVGGGLFQIAVIGPALMAAGPKGGGFIVALMRRGGMGRYFAISGLLTILFGGWYYGGHVRMAGGAFDVASGYIYITLGSFVALLAFLHGAFASMPAERKLIALCRDLKGEPTAEQASQMQALGMKLGRNGVISGMMIGIALLLMLMKGIAA